MANITTTAQAQDPLTGSAIGSSFTVSTSKELTNRETNIITSVESSFLFGPVTSPSLLILRCLSLEDSAVGDPAQPVHWGYSTGVYQHEMYIGESVVIRLRSGGPVTQLYLVSPDGTTPTNFNVEAQVWNQ